MQLIGNQNIKDILTRLAGGGRIPHSLLFAGDDGVGKKRFALWMARSLVCRSPVNGLSCDKSASCLRVEKFAFPRSDDRDAHKQIIFSEHPDVGMAVPSGRNILVDSIRDLERESNFRPCEAGARVFIIDDAEKMNDAAANALLKTLEEPPETAYIFLITSRPDSLLATIRSRCQILRFSAVPLAEVAGRLCDEKNLSPEDAALTAGLSRGSIGRAMSLDLKKYLPQRETMLSVLSAVLIDNEPRAALRLGEKLNDAANKDDYEENIDVLQTLIRDIWILRIADESETIVNVDILPQLNDLAENADHTTLVKWQEQIETMREGLIVNINRKIATDSLFMSMAS